MFDRLRDIHIRNVHDPDHAIYNVPRSSANMPIERPHATSYVGNSNVCHRLRDNDVRTSQCT